MKYKVLINSSEINFSACHFLKEPQKCSRLHGHNYYVSAEIGSDLNENSFVVDFFELKKELKTIIEPLDHFILIPEKSENLNIEIKNESIKIITKSGKKYVFPFSDVKFLPLPATTSELLAKYLHDQLKLRYVDKKIKVKIEESKSTCAIYED
ncbi:MAG: 6-carboxytetrahydropterin synthase [Candidatus Lokiarchaeota archaeon]|nr:6-carboxytetrahydropterin synthase [Candidatus Lokiarchaeota archaeon]